MEQDDLDVERWECTRQGLLSPSSGAARGSERQLSLSHTDLELIHHWCNKKYPLMQESLASFHCVCNKHTMYIQFSLCGGNSAQDILPIQGRGDTPPLPPDMSCTGRQQEYHTADVGPSYASVRRQNLACNVH